AWAGGYRRSDRRPDRSEDGGYAYYGPGHNNWWGDQHRMFRQRAAVVVDIAASDRKDEATRRPRRARPNDSAAHADGAATERLEAVLLDRIDRGDERIHHKEQTPRSSRQSCPPPKPTGLRAIVGSRPRADHLR